jgi:hypothetical protein
MSKILEDAPVDTWDWDAEASFVLSVGMTKAIHNNRRDPSGQAIWEVVQQPTWIVSLDRWARQNKSWMSNVIVMDGVVIALDETAQSFPGDLLVDLENGRLVVHSRDSSAQ